MKSSQSHTATSIFSDHWTLHYGKYTCTNNKRPIAIKVSEFFDSFDIEIVRCTQFATTPPWTLKTLDVDTSLSTYVNKKEAPELLASIVRSKNSDLLRIQWLCPYIYRCIKNYIWTSGHRMLHTIYPNYTRICF